MAGLGPADADTVCDPAGPLVATEADGTNLNSSGTRGEPIRSMRLLSIPTVTLAGVSDAFSSARDAVTTIAGVSTAWKSIICGPFLP
jgi:hypothetical protein